MREQKTPDQARVGDIVAGHRVGRNCLLLLAWSEEPLPTEGLAGFREQRSGKGRFKTYSWQSPNTPAPAPNASWYLLAVQIEGVGAAQPGDLLALQATSTRRPTVARVPDTLLEGAEFAARLGEVLASQQIAVATFLRRTFSDRRGALDPDAGRFLAEYFRHVAREDGAIEIVGSLGGGAMLIQGWSAGLAAGASDLVAEGLALADVQLRLADFSRADLAPPARGVVGVLSAEGVAPNGLRALYFVAAGELRRLPVLSSRLMLEPNDAVGHIRAILPTLVGDDIVLASLRQAARPRFTGHDTLTSSPHPVAAAIDLAFALDGAGYYLAGWMLDPSRAISAVSLRATKGFSARLDLGWTRTTRPDVRDGFSADRRFAGCTISELAGFNAFLPASGSLDGSRWYLEVEIGDDALFLPVPMRDGSGLEARRRILESVDLHKPEAPQVIERQIAPALVAGSSARAGDQGYSLLAGTIRENVATAVLVPVLASTGVQVTLAHFGVDPLAADEQLLLVCSSDVPDATLRQMVRLFGFYGIDGVVVRADRPIDACDALNLGARLTPAARLLLLGTSIVGRQPGWIAALRRAARKLPDVDALSPTVLYEDQSIKFAGIDAASPVAEPPYVAFDGACIGYARDWLKGRAARPVLAGTIECCLIRRDAFEAVGGFAGNYALPDPKGFDFFLRLRGAGRTTAWTPDVEVHSVDDSTAANGEYWSRVAQLADGYMLAERLRESAAAPAEPAAKLLRLSKQTA